MLRFILAIPLAVCCSALWAADEPKTRGLMIVQQEEDDNRARLLKEIQSDDRKTSLIASAELRGGYSDDPEVIAGLLDILEREVLAAGPAARLSPAARRSIYDVLVGMDESAWSNASLQRADRAVGAIDHRLENEVSDEEYRAIQHVYSVLEDLAGVDLAYGEIQGLVEGRTNFTDVDVFICAHAAQDPAVVFQALDFAHAVAAADFGRVRLRASTPELEKDLAPQNAATSVFVDRDHPEEKEFGNLQSIVADYDLPPMIERANLGEASLWYLSVFVCP